ncbi:unnamed protein product [Prorocentrum cordatum]|uniref:PARP n=1 Tax=Prorocentrum cordatum TaxID=2364126 RepID=A0ABN9UKS9_9DINO|nr:unnamed protein product [Polarella glacialis]
MRLLGGRVRTLPWSFRGLPLDGSCRVAGALAASVRALAGAPPGAAASSAPRPAAPRGPAADGAAAGGACERGASCEPPAPERCPALRASACRRAASPGADPAAASRRLDFWRIGGAVVDAALYRMGRAAGAPGADLLESGSAEAEAVLSLYLLASGVEIAGTARPAPGRAVVQRVRNRQLLEQYSAYAADGPFQEGGAPCPRRYREDLVWHGTRLKRADGEQASLAEKLQSIARHGFDPRRCTKGAAPEGGIWISAEPLASFGHGGDGLTAFVLCLAKTHFNEWLGSACARVLQRERVLPLYMLVHC